MKSYKILVNYANINTLSIQSFIGVNFVYLQLILKVCNLKKEPLMIRKQIFA